MVNESRERTQAIFVPDLGPVAPAWQGWTTLFDENGYDATVLHAAHHAGAAGQIAELVASGRAPIVVGHGAGAAAAIRAVHGRSYPDCAPLAARTHGDEQSSASGGGKVLSAAVAISPTRTPLWKAVPSGRLSRAQWGLRDRRLPAVPVLLCVGGRESFPDQRAGLRLEEKLRRGSRDDVTDRQVFSGLGKDLPVGDGWRDVAYFVLDWLTRQDL